MDYSPWLEREILAILKANKNEQNLQNWKAFPTKLGAHAHLTKQERKCYILYIQDKIVK